VSSNHPQLLEHALFQAALPIIHRLERAGFETVFVGGCVRDRLAGRDISDVDIATSAAPDQVIEQFEHVIPTGLQHGTVTVVMDGEAYEVTTFRKESTYEAYRKPSSVEFISDLAEDLLRRDFTINAMAINGRGQLLDPFGGQEDLRNGLVRCVGDADARLQEDALRMLRGIRFAAEFGTGLEPIESATWAAILRHRSLLRHIAMERVGVELHKMVKGRQPDQAMRLLHASGLLAHTKEALPLAGEAALARWSQYAGPQRSAEYGAECGADAESQAGLTLSALGHPSSRWAALCIASGLDEQEARALMQALRYSRHYEDEVTKLVALHLRGLAQLEQAADDWRRSWTKLILEYGTHYAERWLELLEQAPDLTNRSMESLDIACGRGELGTDVEQGTAGAANSQKRSASASIGARLEGLRLVLQELPVHSLQQLVVNGNDLMRQLALRPGPHIRELLQELLLQAALGEVPNEQEALLLAARRLAEKE